MFLRRGASKTDQRRLIADSFEEHGGSGCGLSSHRPIRALQWVCRIAGRSPARRTDFEMMSSLRAKHHHEPKTFISGGIILLIHRLLAPARLREPFGHTLLFFQHGALSRVCLPCT